LLAGDESGWRSGVDAIGEKIEPVVDGCPVTGEEDHCEVLAGALNLLFFIDASAQ